MEWKKEVAFINREGEMSYLEEWISEEPDNLLFIFGPKSSGKTTLLNRFIGKCLPDNRYEIKHFNLREIFIANYRHFIQAFFGIDYSKSKEDVKERREYNLKFFNLAVDTLKGLEEKELDPFVVMKQEMKKTALKGKKTVIVIDELQALEGIYLNGQRELLKELFNFFVAMTKESHLTHVIIASSDGYFIERIYNDSKLKKTSRFLEVDYLKKDDVMFWLGDLYGQSKISAFTLTEQQKIGIWDLLGGSCWEISSFLSDMFGVEKDGVISQDDFEGVVETRKITCRSMFEDYAGLNEQKTGLFRVLDRVNRDKHFIKLRDLAALVEDGLFIEADLRKELSELVRQNFLAYSPVTAEYSLQGRSMEHGLAGFILMIDGDE